MGRALVLNASDAPLAVVSALAMGGWTWTFKPLVPKLHLLNPLAGIGRVFSKQQVVDALSATGVDVGLGVGVGRLGRLRCVGVRGPHPDDIGLTDR